MKSALFSLLIVLLHSIGNAQVIQFEFRDKLTEDAIHGVRISANSGAFEAQTMTNMSGFAWIAVPEEIPELSVSTRHAFYSEYENVLKIDHRRDTTRVVVRLTLEKIHMLQGVTVHPIGTPEVVYGSRRVSVDDFEFLPDGRLILLAYERTMKKGSEVMIYDEDESRIALPNEDKGLELVRDYRGNPNVIGEKSVYGLVADQNRIQVGILDKEYYLSYIAPIVDTTTSKLFFSNYSDKYPAFDYFAYDNADSSYRKILGIKDDFMMELYRSEYKWVDVRTKLWAKEMENSTGVDAEIWVGASVFTQSIYYKELYAPLFRRNDSIFVFDHYKDLLYRFDKSGNKIDSLPIFYHLQPKNSGWRKLLLQDQVTGEIYSVYERNGNATIGRIDVNTGEIVESVPLHFKYPQKLLLRNNKVYYTYRPYESAQKKYLYSETLPVKAREARLQESGEVSQEK